MRRNLSGLRVESLESRDTPATFGTPWPDGDHLSLSLAPNDTSIDGRASDLQTLLSHLGPQAKLDVLRAFQSWAVHANINFGLVADDGSAFGIGGANQGDPRFGDIRVGGIPLAADVLAITAPYNLFDNYSGDVTVNTAAGFGGNGPDLYTALLQESGHALGIGNSPNPTSVMYEYYGGPRGGLSNDDVAAVQALYGPRVPDRYEGSGGNGTLRSATPYFTPVSADITTTSDVDVYRFTTGLLTRSAVVDLRAAGISLLTARVEILDANGRVLTSLLTNDPTNNDLTLTLNSVKPFSTYFVRVSSAQDNAFGVGAYDLKVTQNSLLTDLAGLVSNLLNETGLNDTLLTATSLLSQATAVGPRTEYLTQANFGSASDVDYYRITVPPSADGTVNLLATVWGQHGATLNPWIEGYDSFGHQLSAEVLTADGNTSTVQIRGVTPGQTYFLKLSSDSHTTGAYTMAADLRTSVADLPTGPTRTLDEVTPTDAGGLTLAQTGQVHFVLTADGAAGTGRGVVVTVTAANGAVVATLPAAVGRSRSADVLLPAGSYSLRFTTLDPSAPVSFHLGTAIISDPIGVTPVDTTGTPQPTSPPSPPTPPPADNPPATTDAPAEDPPASPPASTATPMPATSPATPPPGDESAVWY